MKHMTVPQYEGLRIKDILANIGMKNNYRYYLPITKEIHRLPRQWIFNVAYSVIGEPFKEWIHNQINLRNQKVTKEKDLLISMAPEVIAAYQRSTMISRKSLSLIMYSFLC